MQSPRIMYENKWVMLDKKGFLKLDKQSPLEKNSFFKVNFYISHIYCTEITHELPSICMVNTAPYKMPVTSLF